MPETDHLAMNLLLLLALAVPLICLAFLSLLALLGVATLGAVILNTVREIRAALRACWVPPSVAVARDNMAISVRLSFKRNGDVLGVPLITYTSLGLSENERRAYRAALDETLARCAPLPFSDAFGSIIAGRPINVRFH